MFAFCSILFINLLIIFLHLIFYSHLNFAAKAIQQQMQEKLQVSSVYDPRDRVKSSFGNYLKRKQQPKQQETILNEKQPSKFSFARKYSKFIEHSFAIFS